eukprot:c23430_g1_i1 orf=37-243(-)
MCGSRLLYPLSLGEAVKNLFARYLHCQASQFLIFRLVCHRYIVIYRIFFMFAISARWVGQHFISCTMS